MQTGITPEWITYEEAKRLTSLGRTTLWKICSSGDVKTARLGRAIRISRRSLLEYMEHLSQETNEKQEGGDDVGRDEVKKATRN